MQDAFLKIFNRLDQYDDSLNFEAWIHRIAIHTAIDYIRKQQPVWEEIPDNLIIAEEDESNEDDIHYSVERIKQL